jgi:hypothetical protein
MRLPDLPSWEVWHALNNALPRHPLLWFAWGGKDDLLPEPSQTGEVIPSVLMLVGGGVTLVAWLMFGVTPLMLVFLLHGYIGMTGSRSVSGGIALARRRGVYDLMGVTPSGELAGAWAVATRYFRRDVGLIGLHAAAQYLRLIWMLGLFPFTALMLLSMCQGTGVMSTALQQVFNHPLAAFNGFVVLGVMILDYPQALAAGGIVGMIAPTFQQSRFEAQVIAPFLFVTYQTLMTALVLILHTVVMLTIAEAIEMWARPWLSTFVWAGIFVAVREVGLLGLCVVFARRMRATLREVMTIYHRSI